MNIFLGLAETVLREGLIYGIMAMGVTITYKILNFPDLSVDGTFPLGACVAAAAITGGVNPWIACLLAILAGAAAGCVTGLLHVKAHITDLLSGILVMTAMWSVNLIITGAMPTGDDKAKKAYEMLTAFYGALNPAMKKPEVTTYIYATDEFCRLAELGAQLNENADINSGKGMVVMALASVIIGVALFKRIRFLKLVTMAVLGSIVYKACLMIALQLGLPNTYLKLLMAALLTVAIISERVGKKGGKEHA